MYKYRIALIFIHCRCQDKYDIYMEHIAYYGTIVNIQDYQCLSTGWKDSCSHVCIYWYLYAYYIYLCRYVCVYLEPKWPIFWKIWPIRWKVNPAKKTGQMGPRYIYTIIFMSIHLPGKYTTTNVPGVSIMKLQYSDNSALNHISIRKGMLREMVNTWNVAEQTL